jgi:hypothetical protein
MELAADERAARATAPEETPVPIPRPDGSCGMPGSPKGRDLQVHPVGAPHAVLLDPVGERDGMDA